MNKSYFELKFAVIEKKTAPFFAYFGHLSTIRYHNPPGFDFTANLISWICAKVQMDF